jgi:hypothetical protein
MSQEVQWVVTSATWHIILQTPRPESGLCKIWLSSICNKKLGAEDTGCNRSRSEVFRGSTVEMLMCCGS